MISTTLPGSMTDTKPVRDCDYCGKTSTQAGGVEVGAKFKCALCFRRKLIGNLNRKRFAEERAKK